MATRVGRSRKITTALLVAVMNAGALAHTAAADPPVSTNGHPVTLLARGLQTPTSFAFPNGLTLVGDYGAEDGTTPGGLYLLRGGHAARLAGSPAHVSGLAVHRGTLYIGAGSRLLAWSHWDGYRFASRRVIFTPPSGFTGFNGIAFGGDGRLYAGVTLGSNDHSPTSAPYAFDILSLTAAGRDPRIFARGIRQPWQLAFPAGSSSPFVSALGQDAGAVNPPDFLLRVRAGDNYGFPACNWTAPEACAGYTRPYRLLSAHTDPMGLAIAGRRLYVSEWGGSPATPAGVVSMPLGGGRSRWLLHGDWNLIALGANAGFIYVGDSTGHVFRVRL